MYHLLIGVPPPRMMRPPGQMPGMAPPGIPLPPGLPPQNPNVLSAPPIIMKLPQKSGEDEKKKGATIVAKPQIKHVIGDVTRFTPTALKVKREPRGAKGTTTKLSKSKESTISLGNGLCGVVVSSTDL